MSLDPLRLFSDIDTSNGLVVAVSGGSDSLALLLLLHDFFLRQPLPPPLLAVTIDHGLRMESAQEAMCVAAFCQAHGINHRTLIWQGNKPQSGISAAAREARYALLAKAADEAGTKIILTGHTLDDQAETLAMRALRGEGAGLAGMAPATLYDGHVWIVRPLLSLRRNELRDWLSARKIDWIDDPSNEDPAYERVRIRKNLTEAEIEMLAQQALQAGCVRTALSQKAGRLVERFMTCPAPGLYQLERDLFVADANEPGLLAFRAALATIGGTPRLPDPDRSRTLFLRLVAGIAEHVTGGVTGRVTRRVTLSRIVVEMRPNAVFLWREARHLPDIESDGKAMIWDRRFHIQAPAGLRIAPLGKMWGSETQTDAPKRLAHTVLARAALAAQPGVFRQEEFIGPAVELAAHGVTVTPLAAPFSRFLPGFDLALADALGRLVNAPPLAGLPWKHHIRTDA